LSGIVLSYFFKCKFYCLLGDMAEEEAAAVEAAITTMEEAAATLAEEATTGSRTVTPIPGLRVVTLTTVEIGEFKVLFSKPKSS